MSSSSRTRSSGGYADRGYNGRLDPSDRHYSPPYKDVEMRPASPPPPKRHRDEASSPPPGKDRHQSRGSSRPPASSSRPGRSNDTRHHPYPSSRPRSRSSPGRSTIERPKSRGAEISPHGSPTEPVAEKSRDPRVRQGASSRPRHPSETPTMSSPSWSPIQMSPTPHTHQPLPTAGPPHSPQLSPSTTHWAQQPPGSSSIQLPMGETTKPLLGDAEWFKDVPKETMVKYLKGKSDSTIEARRNHGLRPFFHKCGFDARARYGDVMVAIFEELGILTLLDLGVLCDRGLEFKLVEKLATQYHMPWLPRKCFETGLSEFKEERKKIRGMGGLPPT